MSDLAFRDFRTQEQNRKTDHISHKTSQERISLRRFTIGGSLNAKEKI